jgi:hypothetical protein
MDKLFSLAEDEFFLNKCYLCLCVTFTVHFLGGEDKKAKYAQRQGLSNWCRHGYINKLIC